MDRFIAGSRLLQVHSIVNLKSNMDRFIDFGNVEMKWGIKNLKSNMDRFIENKKKNNKPPNSI